MLNRYPSALEYVCLNPARAVSVPAADEMLAFQHESDYARYVALPIGWCSQKLRR